MFSVRLCGTTITMLEATLLHMSLSRLLCKAASSKPTLCNELAAAAALDCFCALSLPRFNVSKLVIVVVYHMRLLRRRLSVCSSAVHESVWLRARLDMRMCARKSVVAMAKFSVSQRRILCTASSLHKITLFSKQFHWESSIDWAQQPGYGDFWVLVEKIWATSRNLSL